MRAAEFPRVPLSDSLASAAGATRRASRTITNAIPPKSNIATAEPTNSSEPELDVLLDVLAGVVAVGAVVVVVSDSPFVSSLNELPLPRFADWAACGSVHDDASASAAHTTSSDAVRLGRRVPSLLVATARGYRRRMRSQAGGPARAWQTLE
jgi:hypothetical protein